jgi:hypothetical protein
MPRCPVRHDRRVVWHTFVERRGWSDQRYAAWLGRLWAAMLVDPTPHACRGVGRERLGGIGLWLAQQAASQGTWLNAGAGGNLSMEAQVALTDSQLS